MGRASPLIAALNAGEFSKDLEGRVDISKYPASCKRIENFLLLVQGPAMRRAGSRFLATTKNNGRALYVKFEFSSTISFQLEFGDHYLRVDTQHGFVESAPAVPYEIVSPYAVADLWNPDDTPALAVEQSGDVLYIANMYGTYKPQKLTRFANDNWVFSDYAPNQGPFLDLNITATTIYASAQSGSMSLVASAAAFALTDIGRLIRLEIQTFNDPPWEDNKGYSIGDLARSDGKTYKALNSATSGVQPPTHEHDAAYDGKAGVQWSYQDPGYGVARITAVADTTHATATVIVDAPNGLNLMPASVVGSGNATKRWKLGAWSATTGYPRYFKFFKQRLFATTRLGVYATVSSDFENHAPDFFGQVRQDNAINATLQDANSILWMEATKVLLIGTGGGEFVAGPLTSTEPMGPANFGIDKQSKERVRSIPPIISGNSLLFIQAAGRKLMGMDYQVATDNFVSTDLSVLNNRITASGIIASAYQAQPYSMLWHALANGKLIAFTYDKQQEVTGWARHPIGGNGIVESVIVTPAPDGSREEVYLIVRRTINGVTVRYKEFFEKPYEAPDDDGTGGDLQSSCFYVDSGLTYDGPPITHITGLIHLVGETVQVLGDGAVLPDCVVASDGSIDIARACSVVQAGLQCTARIVTMRLEAGSQDGTSQGKTKRIHKVIARFLDALGGLIGPYNGRKEQVSKRMPATPMGSPPPIDSGDKSVDFPGDYETEARVEVIQEQPLPMTVAALMPRLRTYDS